MVFYGECGGRGEGAVEECHFRFGADEHVFECAIGKGFEKDVASIVC